MNQNTKRISTESMFWGTHVCTTQQISLLVCRDPRIVNTVID